MSYITIDGNVFVLHMYLCYWNLPDRQVLDFGGRMGNFWGLKKSVAVTDGDGSQMLRGRMGTETMSDGDGWGWIPFLR